jgi:transcriptional repressor NrdR
MHCPQCGHLESRVIDTTPDSHNGIRRRRECENCHFRFSTYERLVRTTPMIIKRDNTREEFSREKLLNSIKVACVKRPIPAEAMERLAGEVEARLQKINKLEVPSRTVGDLVIDGLKKMDLIAYIRYASVYLPLASLEEFRNEIDQLLGGKK